MPRVNEYGFIETPYRRVMHEVDNQPDTQRRAATLAEDVVRSRIGRGDGRVADA